ncbi:hypothetical protein D6D24_09480 [Aureobasidium pullulans]|uniref:Uncharacterized protein n=1 Tax=Aureobasidium pullulans TaxID=5580 RepID=A0A4S8V930_AURPU|nr:hypothetical protein D6D24_09480 [Aureobasidium pullulans]
MNSVKNYTLSPKAVSEKLADKVNSFDPMAENHDELIVKWDGDSTVSSEWSFNMTPKEDVTDPFEKFSDDDYPAISGDTLEKFDRTMGATNTMALYTTALLSYISFLSSSPVITLATPSLASQENNLDLDDDDSDDIIPDLADISSASSKDTFPCIIRHQSCSFFAKGHTASPLTPTSTTTFFMTSIKEFTPRCSLFPVVDSVITRSHTLPSSPAVSSFPNSPNNLFTLSDLEHRNLGYMQADSTIYANDSTWRWWNYLIKHRGAIPKLRPRSDQRLVSGGQEVFRDEGDGKKI